ncbi:hypothetical protein SeMB42_g08007 [Synchytrium endobioticum]|uniref:Uncharacterized protein n=1 Tax=Synchytrium endobioticum TaxID=286115 RepID=A0A507BQ31_9FUNG|nr:hypothetical protein SeMB42_g08007 [Synchytrium endobioticum]
MLITPERFWRSLLLLFCTSDNLLRYDDSSARQPGSWYKHCSFLYVISLMSYNLPNVAVAFDIREWAKLANEKLLVAYGTFPSRIHPCYAGTIARLTGSLVDRFLSIKIHHFYFRANSSSKPSQAKTSASYWTVIQNLGLAVLKAGGGAPID